MERHFINIRPTHFNHSLCSRALCFWKSQFLIAAPSNALLFMLSLPHSSSSSLILNRLVFQEYNISIILPFFVCFSICFVHLIKVETWPDFKIWLTSWGYSGFEMKPENNNITVIMLTIIYRWDTQRQTEIQTTEKNIYEFETEES